MGNPQGPAFAARIAGADPEALETLYEACGEAVVRLLERFFPGEGEDLRHEVFLKLREEVARGRFEARARLSTWAWRVTANWCVDERRRRRRREGRTLPIDRLAAEPPASADVAEEAALADDVRRLFEKGCPGLRGPERRVLHLRFVEGLTYRQIAELLGAPLGTVSTWFNEAIRKLREALGAEGRPITRAARGVQGERRPIE